MTLICMHFLLAIMISYSLNSSDKTCKHTSKWRTTRTSSVYFPTIPVPYRFFPEGVEHHVPSRPSLNFIRPTEAWDPARFWPDYCTRKLGNEVFCWGKPQILKNEATITRHQPKKPCAPKKMAGSLHFGKLRFLRSVFKVEKTLARLEE